MHQILFTIPLHSWFGILWDIPIHGYGFMLFLAFVSCTLLAMYLARKQEIPPETIQDLALWLFLSGIIGARVVYVIQYWGPQFSNDLVAIFRIWDGGLIFYGSALGGAVGYIGFYHLVMKPKQISFWKLADIIAPCIALGLCLGRVGCLLNGCCYGGVACTECPAVSFPLPSMPRYELVRNGFQTAAGFLVDQTPIGAIKVKKVEPNSPAADAGLLEGDVILEAEGKKVEHYGDLDKLLEFWQLDRRGQNTLHLKVRHPNGNEVPLAFAPWTIGLHPTQIYESISTGLLVFLLLSYYPLRRHNGELFVLLMIGYSIHRFLNEAIRIDTDRYWDGLTLSQNISLGVFLTAIVVGIWIWRKPTETLSGPSQSDKKVPPAEPVPIPEQETAIQD